MSYNITGVKIKEIDLNISLNDFIDTQKIMKESSFFFQIKTKPIPLFPGQFLPEADEKEITIKYDEDELEYLKGILLPSGIVSIKDLGWGQYQSEYPITDRLVDLCIKYKGNLNMIIVWEGGDSIEQIIINKGVKEKEGDI